MKSLSSALASTPWQSAVRSLSSCPAIYSARASDNWHLDGDTITVNMMQWKRRGGREVIIAPAGGGAWAAPGQGGRAYADKTTPHVYVIDGDAGSSLHGRDRRQADDRPGRR